jgi:hypothetical protein
MKAMRSVSVGRGVRGVAVAAALVAQIPRVVAGAVAGRGGNVATQHRPAGGVLVDQVVAGGLGIAAEVADDRIEQDATLVGEVAVVVTAGAGEALLRPTAYLLSSSGTLAARPSC